MSTQYTEEEFLKLKQEYESYQYMVVKTIQDKDKALADLQQEYEVYKNVTEKTIQDKENIIISLQQEYGSYQNMAEKTMQDISKKNMSLEKKLDALVNIVEVSKYINLYLSDPNLLQMINDMVLGIIGVTYSTIYMMENNKLTVKITNITQNSTFFEKENLIKINNNNPFVLNCETPIYLTTVGNLEIHSLIGVPIVLRDKFLGYIILEHTLFNFFNKEHIKFMSSITNQIAVALENALLYKQIKEASEKDPLLGIYNRRYFFEVVERKIKENSNHKFAIVMVDLDNFKKANDVYGHQFGDEVLKQTTKLISDKIESNDIVARYGGEEIVIYIDNAEDIKKVYNKVDAIRDAISKNVITCGSIQGSITASLGISFYLVDSPILAQVLNIADTRLYTAKHTGKNKVVSIE